jgi:hypothetical protein
VFILYLDVLCNEYYLFHTWKAVPSEGKIFNKLSSNFSQKITGVALWFATLEDTGLPETTKNRLKICLTFSYCEFTPIQIEHL